MLKKASPVPGSWLWPDNDLCHLCSQASSFKFWPHWTGALGYNFHVSLNYDSLYSCAETHLEAQIAAVAILEFTDVPIQSGTRLQTICNCTCLRGGELELFFVVVLFFGGFFYQTNGTCGHISPAMLWGQRINEDVSSLPKAERKKVCLSRPPKKLQFTASAECLNYLEKSKEWYHLDMCYCTTNYLHWLWCTMACYKCL